MAKIFCVANQKGGVGKTTTTVNLAAGLAQIGQRVLMVDLDPQGNATMGSGVDKRSLQLTVYDVLIEEATVREAAVLAEASGYHVLGANRELAGAEIELVQLERREKRLKAALADFTAWSRPALAPGAVWLAMKGKHPAEEIAALPASVEVFHVEPLQVPGLQADRCIVWMRPRG